MAREVIAVDLDGVCYEFWRTARYMLRYYRKAELPTNDHWLERKDVGATDWDWLWGAGVKKGLFLHGHMVKGARIGVEQLVKDGFKVAIATHRPENATIDTLKWCGLHFEGIPLAGFYMHSSRYPKTNGNWDLLIDDKPENIDDAYLAGRKGLLFDQPWNQESVHYRVSGWENVSWAVKNVLKGV